MIQPYHIQTNDWVTKPQSLGQIEEKIKLLICCLRSSVDQSALDLTAILLGALIHLKVNEAYHMLPNMFKDPYIFAKPQAFSIFVLKSYLPMH